MKINEVISEGPNVGGVVSKIMGATEKEAPFWLRQAGKVDAAVEKKAANAASNRAMAKVLAYRGEQFVDALGWLNITVQWYDYYTESSALDAKLKAKSISPEDYKRELATLRGRFITGVIGPKVALKLANKVGVNWVLGRLPWLMKTLGMPNAAKITATIGTTAGATAAYAFFMSDKGKNWLTQALGSVMTGIGILPGLLGELYDYLTGQVHDTGAGGNPAGNADIAGNSTPPATAPAGQGRVPAYDATGKDLGWTSSNDWMTTGGGTASPVAKSVK